MRPKAVDEDKEKKGLAGKDGSNDGEAVGGQEGARGVGEGTEKRTSCRKTALPPPPPPRLRGERKRRVCRGCLSAMVQGAPAGR